VHLLRLRACNSPQTTLDELRDRGKVMALPDKQTTSKADA